MPRACRGRHVSGDCTEPAQAGKTGHSSLAPIACAHTLVGAGGLLYLATLSLTASAWMRVMSRTNQCSAESGHLRAEVGRRRRLLLELLQAAHAVGEGVPLGAQLRVLRGLLLDHPLQRLHRLQQLVPPRLRRQRRVSTSLHLMPHRRWMPPVRVRVVHHRHAGVGIGEPTRRHRFRAACVQLCTVEQ